MHEMSIAHSILTQIEKLAEENKAQKALWVKVTIGVLSGVVPEQLQLAFDIYKKQFDYSNELELRMETKKLQLKCLECGEITEQSEMHVQCAHCNSFMVEVLDGKDMIIEKVELDV